MELVCRRRPPVHSVVLIDRCPACWRRQPAVSQDVRIGICALCGESLAAEPLALGDPVGPDASRRLWFARQAAVFTHALDVAELLGLDVAAMAAARRDGLHALFASVQDYPYRESVTKKVAGRLVRDSHATLDALFSILWRARCPLPVLFPSADRSVIEPNGR